MLEDKRKLVVVLVGVVLATLCLLIGAIDQETWKWAFSVTVVAFMVGNGMEHLSLKGMN